MTHWEKIYISSIKKSHKILLTFNFRKRSAGPTHVTFEYGFLMAESSANFT